MGVPGAVLIGALIDPLNPVPPGGTDCVAAGTTTVFFSHALKASTAIATENINEYFISTPRSFDENCP